MWFDVGQSAGRKRAGVRAERLADIIKLPHPTLRTHTIPPFPNMVGSLFILTQCFRFARYARYAKTTPLVGKSITLILRRLLNRLEKYTKCEVYSIPGPLYTPFVLNRPSLDQNLTGNLLRMVSSLQNDGF